MGEGGYGWLPYDCGTRGLADGLVLLTIGWVSTGQFKP